MPASHYGKGSDRRKSQVSLEELDLREALWRTKDPIKKQQIKKKLEELQNEKSSFK